jgi:hypothetical protein
MESLGRRLSGQGGCSGHDTRHKAARGCQRLPGLSAGLGLSIRRSQGGKAGSGTLGLKTRIGVQAPGPLSIVARCCLSFSPQFPSPFASSLELLFLFCFGAGQGSSNIRSSSDNNRGGKRASHGPARDPSQRFAVVSGSSSGSAGSRSRPGRVAARRRLS